MGTAFERAIKQAISKTEAERIASALRKFDVYAIAELDCPGSWAVKIKGGEVNGEARFTSKDSLDYLKEAVQAGIDNYIKEWGTDPWRKMPKGISCSPGCTCGCGK